MMGAGQLFRSPFTWHESPAWPASGAVFGLRLPSVAAARAVPGVSAGRALEPVLEAAAAWRIGYRSWSVGRAELVSGEYHGRDRAGAIRFAVGFYSDRRV